MKLRIASLVAAITIGVSCAKSPAAPDDPYVGTWRGTITDAVQGAGSLEIKLEKSDADRYRGTWKMTFPSTVIVGALEFIPAMVESIFMACGWAAIDADAALGSQLSLLKLQFDGDQAAGALRPSIGTISCRSIGGGPVSLTRR